MLESKSYLFFFFTTTQGTANNHQVSQMRGLLRSLQSALRYEQESASILYHPRSQDGFARTQKDTTHQPTVLSAAWPPGVAVHLSLYPPHPATSRALQLQLKPRQRGKQSTWVNNVLRAELTTATLRFLLGKGLGTDTQLHALDVN